jgi:hypothetical protein
MRLSSGPPIQAMQAVFLVVERFGENLFSRIVRLRRITHKLTTREAASAPAAEEPMEQQQARHLSG